MVTDAALGSLFQPLKTLSVTYNFNKHTKKKNTPKPNNLNLTLQAQSSSEPSEVATLRDAFEFGQVNNTSEFDVVL